MLACQRYIELNPVRAGIVAHTEQYPWSSYRANAQGESNTLIKPHTLYEALAPDEIRRQVAYRELFRAKPETVVVDNIRRATNGNFVLGNQTFTEQLSAALRRRAVPGKSGRPRLMSEPESSGKLCK